MILAGTVTDVVGIVLVGATLLNSYGKAKKLKAAGT